MNQNYFKFRIFLLVMGILGVLFSFLAMWMSQFRDPTQTVITMLLCAVYALLRAINGEDRRETRACYMIYHGTHMAVINPVRLYIRAAVAWALCDSLWIAADFTTCLTWGIPGVLVTFFQALFLIGFAAALEFKPELYDTQEKAQAADLTEAMMYGVACAAVCVAAWFYMRTNTGGI